jgi:hypothetical protein
MPQLPAASSSLGGAHHRRERASAEHWDGERGELPRPVRGQGSRLRSPHRSGLRSATARTAQRRTSQLAPVACGTDAPVHRA